MDTASLDEMRATLDQVRADIQEIDTDLKALEVEKAGLIEKRQRAVAAAEYLEGRLGRQPSITEKGVGRRVSPQADEPETRLTTRLKKPSGRKQVVDFAREIMPLEGRPLEPQELYALIIERGIKLDTRNPDHTVRRTLSELKDIFIHIEGKGYWLANMKLPDAS